MGKHVLVTGSEGYIGKVLVKILLDQGYQVTGLDADYYFDGYLYPSAMSGYRLLRKDIRHVNKEDLRGIDAIVHLSALSNDPVGALNPGLTKDINFQATVRLAKLARKVGVKRFIFSSSCSMYGISDKAMVTEEDEQSPLTAYAISKVDCERELLKLADKAFSPVFMRNATVYGVSPKLRLDLVVNNLVGSALSTKKISIQSDGTPWRPLIHVEDLSHAFVAMLQAPRSKVHGQAFNIGFSDGNYQVKGLAEMIKEQLPDCTVEILNLTGGDTRSYRVDFSKFKNAFPSFKSRWTMKQGITHLIETYRANGLTTSEEFLGRKYTRIKQLKFLQNAKKLDEDLYWE